MPQDESYTVGAHWHGCMLPITTTSASVFYKATHVRLIHGETATKVGKARQQEAMLVVDVLGAPI